VGVFWWTAVRWRVRGTAVELAAIAVSLRRALLYAKEEEEVKEGDGSVSWRGRSGLTGGPSAGVWPPDGERGLSRSATDAIHNGHQVSPLMPDSPTLATINS
jgi:hypothetical protein